MSDPASIAGPSDDVSEEAQSLTAVPNAIQTGSHTRLARIDTFRTAFEQRRRSVSLAMLLGILLVVIPTSISAVYFGFIASNQYVSETRFGVRSADPSRNDATAIFQGMASASQIGLDSNVVVQYMQSSQLVASLERTLNFRQIFSDRKIDWYSRLNPESSSEELTAYWRTKIDAYFDLTTGLISVKVRAFTPADAQQLAIRTLELAEQLVNDMSQKAREDAVQQARGEVSRAEERLQKAREALLNFQNQSHILDVKKQADNSMLLVSRLKDDIAHLEAQKSAARSYLTEDSPSIRSMTNQLNGLQQQLRLAESYLTTNTATKPGDETLSAAMATSTKLEAERSIAEKYYDSALDMMQKAQMEASRQGTYLQAFVRPTLPQSPLYPHRLEAIFLTLLAGLGAWVLTMLTISSIRDHT